MNFKDQYNHPNWQKKRLEVLDYCGFTCQNCDSSDRQLHVHHREYKKARKVWEYDIDNFVVVCCDCHEGIHESISMLKNLLSDFRKEECEWTIELVRGYFQYIRGTMPIEKDIESFTAGYIAFMLKMNMNLIEIATLCSKADKNRDVFIKYLKEFK